MNWKDLFILENEIGEINDRFHHIRFDVCWHRISFFLSLCSGQYWKTNCLLWRIRWNHTTVSHQQFYWILVLLTEIKLIFDWIVNRLLFLWWSIKNSFVDFFIFTCLLNRTIPNTIEIKLVKRRSKGLLLSSQFLFLLIMSLILRLFSSFWTYDSIPWSFDLHQFSFSLDQYSLSIRSFFVCCRQFSNIGGKKSCQDIEWLFVSNWFVVIIVR